MNTNAVWNIGTKEWFDTDNGIVKSNMWMFNQLYDYVKDNRKPFIKDFIDYVTYSTNFNFDKEWFEKSQIMSIFAAVTFYFDNYYYSSDGKVKHINNTDTGTTLYKQPTIIIKDIQAITSRDKR